MRKIFFLIFILSLSQMLNAQVVLNVDDEKYMDELELKLKKREEYFKILQSEGPDAYLAARKLNLNPEDKKLFSQDLIKLQMSNKPLRVYVDRARLLMVVSEGDRQSTYDIRLLRKGIVQTPKGDRIIYKGIPYSELREIADLKSKRN